MLTRKAILAMTAAAVVAVPVLAFGQANTGGSSMMPQVTQTTPQQGPLQGYPAAREGAVLPGGPLAGPAPGREVTPNMPVLSSPQALGNPAGAAEGLPLPTSGGLAAAPGAPPDASTGLPTPPLAGQVGIPLGAPAANAFTNTGPGLVVNPAGLRMGRRASRVIGATVYNEQGESIGSVDDLIVPAEGGNPVAVLSVGGFLGIGSKLVAVPYERLQWTAERERWMLPGATKEGLQQLPGFGYPDAAAQRRG